MHLDTRELQLLQRALLKYAQSTGCPKVYVAEATNLRNRILTHIPCERRYA